MLSICPHLPHCFLAHHAPPWNSILFPIADPDTCACIFICFCVYPRLTAFILASTYGYGACVYVCEFICVIIYAPDLLTPACLDTIASRNSPSTPHQRYSVRVKCISTAFYLLYFATDEL